MRHATFAELSSWLYTRTDLVERGWTNRAIGAAVANARLHRVRRGWYIDSSTWATLWPESRHLAHVIAVARDASGRPPVFCLVSAAVVWDIPLYRIHPERVHVLMGEAARSSATDVHRHEGRVEDTDLAVRHGLTCTSQERTVIDLARMASMEAGLAGADAVLGSIAGGPRSYHIARADEWRDALTQRVSESQARGIRKARLIVTFADGRAELPGESVSRLQLRRLGFATPSLQVPVQGPHRDYWVDFGLGDVRAFGEFDGKSKYTDEAKRSGRSLEQVLLDEKMREDTIRGITQWRFARWGDEHASTASKLATRLAGFGIVPPGR